MLVDTSTRSTHPEIMDDFEMEGELLRRTLDRLDWINRWLGGNQITVDGLKKLLEGVPKDQALKIVDIGCGSGDMLRIVAKYMRQAGRIVELTGIDANEFTVNYAREQSKAYPEIRYLCQTIPCESFHKLEYDILISTLFLHHFSTEQILDVLKSSSQKARIGIVINDLHRSRLAYILFWLLTLIVGTPMIRQDGLTSILRGFKKTELHFFSKKLNLTKYTIQWRWAFRYQWTIKLN